MNESENEHVTCTCVRLAEARQRIAQLEQANRRLTWALRAIDTRLHAEMTIEHFMIDEGSPDELTYYAISARTLRQMCNVAVALTAERPEEPA